MQWFSNKRESDFDFKNVAMIYDMAFKTIYLKEN